MGRRRKRRLGSQRHPGVTLLRPGGRRTCWVLRWVDPDGNEHQKSTGLKLLAHEEQARKRADEMSSRLGMSSGWETDVTWDAFCLRYEEEHLAHGAAGTIRAWRTPRNWYQRLMRPQFLDDVNASTISRFASLLRKELESGTGHVREATIASYLKHLRAALNWAESIGLLAEKVKVRIPSRAKGQSKHARSRSITLEEFERIILTVPKYRLKRRDAPQWERFLWGLWESGFRLGELVELSWDEDSPVSLDTTGPIPLVRFLAAGEKSHTDRLQPITPQFWALISATPPEERRGRVFPVVDSRGRPYAVDWIGRVISRIGKRAGVKTGFGSDKMASSHDIGKRSLTTRLAAKLSESEVAEWMRHQDPATTRRYYYTPTVEALAGRIWNPQGDTQGDTGGNSAENQESGLP